MGYDTGLAVPADVTMLVVVRNVTLCPMWMAATGFLNYSNVPMLYNAQSGAASSVADLAAPVHGGFGFYAGLLPGGARGKAVAIVGGNATSATAEIVGGTKTADTVRIGTSGVANGGAGVAQIAYAAMFGRVLTDQEILAAYTSLQAYLGLRGVTVV